MAHWTNFTQYLSIYRVRSVQYPFQEAIQCLYMVSFIVKCTKNQINPSQASTLQAQSMTH